MSSVRNITSPIGKKLNCKGWHQEAALRMLHNNLDRDVAENPNELIVYGGYGKAARNWKCFDKIHKFAFMLHEFASHMRNVSV